MDMNSHERAVGRSRSKWIFLFFALIALFFLVSEHQAHLFGALPYLLLLACPLLHLFHGHGHHGAHRHAEQSAPSEKATDTDAASR